jgi:hypothetical protein
MTKDDGCMPNIDINIIEEAEENTEEASPQVEEEENDKELTPPLSESEKSEEELFDKKVEQAQEEIEEETEKINKKTGKKKRKCTPEQLERLAKMRVKAAEKRRAIALAKKKDDMERKAEKKLAIKKRKEKKMERDAETELLIEEQTKQNNYWDEDRLVNLMNRTMDSYMDRRKAEKMKRETIKQDASMYINYVHGQNPMNQPYRPRSETQYEKRNPYDQYFHHNKTKAPKNTKPQPPQPVYRNPYSKQFGLTPEDEDEWNL